MKCSTKHIRRLCCPCAILLLLISAIFSEQAFSQSLSTNITGTVIAEKGEALAGVTVRANRSGSDETLQSLTDGKGVFIFRQLSIGASRIGVVNLAGVASVKDGGLSALWTKEWP